MTIKRLIVSALFAFAGLSTYAQSKEALWIEYYPDFQVGRWRLTPEISYRSVDFSGSHTAYFRPTATYGVNKYLSVAGALSYYASWSDFTVNKHEWSIYQNLATRTPSLAGFYLGLNVRMEEIFAKTSRDPDHTFGLRLRWSPKLTYDLPFWTEKKLSLSVFAETYNFLTSSQANYFRNGLDLGAGFTVSPVKRIDVIFEYRRQRSYRPGPDAFSNLFRFMIRHSIL